MNKHNYRQKKSKTKSVNKQQETSWRLLRYCTTSDVSYQWSCQ